MVVVGDDTAVRAYDASSGALGWCRPHAGAVAVAGQTVVVLAPTGTLTGVDPATGHERWSVKTAPSPEGVLLPGLPLPLLGGRTNAYLDTSMLSPPGSVIAIDPATGATRWTWTPTECDAAQAGQPVPPGQPLPMCVGGPWTPVEGPLVYLSDINAARIVALDPGTGAQRWAIATDGQSGAISATDDTVAFVSSAIPTAPSAEGETPPLTGRLVAVDARSGAQRWATPFAPSVLEPVVTGDLVVTLTQSEVPRPHRQDPSRRSAHASTPSPPPTGTVTWTHQLPGETPTTVTPVGDVLVMESLAAASSGPGFFALDPATGEDRWRTEHRSAYAPTTGYSTSGYETPIPVAGGSRFASLITYGASGS